MLSDTIKQNIAPRLRGKPYWFGIPINLILFSLFVYNKKERVREKRNFSQLTQEALSGRAEISPKYLGQIERAEVNPTIEILKKIADGLKIELSELFTFPSSNSISQKEVYIHKILYLLKEKDEKVVKIALKIITDIAEEI
ncbi:MAG: helix-turn-helix transcriptional regulator [bacterium]